MILDFESVEAKEAEYLISKLNKAYVALDTISAVLMDNGNENTANVISDANGAVFDATNFLKAY